MSQYLKLTTEVKTAVGYEEKKHSSQKSSSFPSDADLKLAPFFDGYDRRRLGEQEKELNVRHSDILALPYSQFLVSSNYLY